jgi:hypothetical protein
MRLVKRAEAESKLDSGPLTAHHKQKLPSSELGSIEIA